MCLVAPLCGLKLCGADGHPHPRGNKRPDPPSPAFTAVRRAARRCGLKEVGEEEDWTVYWTDCSVSLERVMEMKRFQVPAVEPQKRSRQAMSGF